MATKLKNVVVKEIALVPRGANNKKFYLTKSADAPETETEIMANTDTPNTPAAPSAEAVALKKAQEDLATQTAKLEALEKAQKAADEKALALEKALATERDAKETADAIRKAADTYKNIPAKAEELGPVLRLIRKMDGPSADLIETILGKVDAIVKQALDPKGSALANDKTGAAWDEIKKLADAAVSAKTATSFAKAVDAVLATPEGKALYAQHQQDQASARANR